MYFVCRLFAPSHENGNSQGQGFVFCVPLFLRHLLWALQTFLCVSEFSQWFGCGSIEPADELDVLVKEKEETRMILKLGRC